MYERDQELIEERPGAGQRYLSPREIEILLHAANGLADKQIARHMGLQLSTVRTYWERARQKLSASNRTHAVSMLVALGIVQVNITHLSVLIEGMKMKEALSRPDTVHNGKP